jgi:uncharacterized SAM-binding protein YcdF (DUF218 family)
LSSRAYPDGVKPVAVVVPGSAHRRTRERLVRDAERVAAATEAPVVVFSGLGEAEHMRALWRGPNVELVVEGAATSTVENAVRTLPLLVEREVRAAFVVCAPAHVFRARWIFRRIYGAHGIAVQFRVARVAPTPGAIAWELAAATVARRQVRGTRDR